MVGGECYRSYWVSWWLWVAMGMALGLNFGGLNFSAVLISASFYLLPAREFGEL